MDGKVPGGSYWKYSFLWSNTTSWVSFLASLTIYLDTEQLATKPEGELMMGLGADKCTTLKLDVEEYLIGLTHLCNELVLNYRCCQIIITYTVLKNVSSQSRLSVNCVTSEDYSRPEKIATFITSLNSGFRSVQNITL